MSSSISGPNASDPNINKNSDPKLVDSTKWAGRKVTEILESELADTILKIPLLQKIAIIENLSLTQIISLGSSQPDIVNPHDEERLHNVRQIVEISNSNEIWDVVADKIGFTPSARKPGVPRKPGEVREQTLAFINKLKSDLERIPFKPQNIHGILKNPNISYEEIGTLIQYKDFLKEQSTVRVWKRLAFQAHIDIVRYDDLFGSLPSSFKKYKPENEGNIASEFKKWMEENREQFRDFTQLWFAEDDDIQGDVYWLPNEICDLTALTEIRITRLNLIELPEQIGKLTNLTSISVTINLLKSLPESIGELTNLIQLFISDNRLTSLPESLGKLSNLAILNASYNRLTTLPDSIGNLTKLDHLNLRQNELGIIQPEIFQGLPITTLSIDENANPYNYDEAKWKEIFPHTFILNGHLLN